VLTSKNTKRHSRIELVRGRGATLWDAHGVSYLDFSCSYGPIVLGYANEEVNAAARAQIERGALFPWATSQVDELSALVCANMPRATECLFFKTGSEAVAAGARLARAATGRQTIVRCGFHGWHDGVISPFYHWHDADGIAEGREIPGVAGHSTRDWIVWDGRSVAGLDQILAAHDGGIAALIVDPVQFREPIGEAIAACSNTIRRAGGLFILDEVKTAFRVGPGGIQKKYGVSADLSIVSKALGNGFPIAGVVCTNELERFAATAKIKGTYNSDLVSIAAATATLKLLESRNVAARLQQIGSTLIAGFNDLAHEVGVEDRVRAMPFRWDCMPHVTFAGDEGRARSERFASDLLERGIVWLANHMNYISMAHTEADVARFLDACRSVLRGAVTGR